MRTWSLTSDLKHRQLGLLAALWFAGAVLASIIIMHETNEVFDNAMSETANAVMAMMLPGDQTSLEARDRIERVALAGDRRKYMTFQLRPSRRDHQQVGQCAGGRIPRSAGAGLLGQRHDALSDPRAAKRRRLCADCRILR